MKNKYLILVIMFLLRTAIFGQNTKLASFTPGEPWLDTNGDVINAHGGGILLMDGIYYWFGEHKGATNDARVGVTCYSSRDLYNWKNEGVALAVSSDPDSEITSGCTIERPKVIYNKKNKKFVMWFHLELKGQGYSAAKTGVATANSPNGPYTYLKSFRPNANSWPVGFEEAWKNDIPGQDTLKQFSPQWYKAVKEGLFLRRDFKSGQMARDMQLYIDNDGKAYHIHASEENLTLHISELTEDYLDFTGKYVTVAPAGHNEAPALFSNEGVYYMITSGCTGWDPNAARSFKATSVLGPWTSLGNPCTGTDAELTFHSQSTFIIPVAGKRDAFIFMADRWKPDIPIDGRYIWLPLQIKDGKPVLEWKSEWKLEDLKR